MTFDWREYLSIAKILVASNTMGFAKEAATRSAVSRAYYAAFCFARNHARDHPGYIPKNDESEHSAVPAYFRQRRMYNIADRLGRLRQWRNECDYADVVREVDSMAENALQTSEYIIVNLDQLLKR